MIITSLSMTKAKIQIGRTELFLYEIGGHLTIRSMNESEALKYELLKYKKGSLSFRVSKGMKIKNAIKDLIRKAKGCSTEIILINCSD